MNIKFDDEQEKVEPMSAAEVMDTFSLHNFMVRNGAVVEEALEYQSFKRTYGHMWEQVQPVIRSLEKLCLESGIHVATVNGKLLVELAKRTGGQGVITLDELVKCFVNEYDFV